MGNLFSQKFYMLEPHNIYFAEVTVFLLTARLGGWHRSRKYAIVLLNLVFIGDDAYAQN